MSLDFSFFTTYLFPIFSTFGLISLVWNFYNLYQSQKAFLKLNLECKYESDGNKKYIISKTSVENTGRIRIKIGQAYLRIKKEDERKPGKPIPLPYYVTDVVALGKMANFQFTHIEKVGTPGVYLVIFRIRGKPHFKGKTTAAFAKFMDLFDFSGEDIHTHDRFVKDSVVVKEDTDNNMK